MSQQRFLRVHYEIKPTREIKTADYVEMHVSNSELETMLTVDNPSWSIKKIERGLLPAAIPSAEVTE